MVDVAKSHGRDHDRKSKPSKQKRFQKRAAKKKTDAEKEFDEIQRQWDDLTDEQRKLRPDLNPDNFRFDRDKKLYMQVTSTKTRRLFVSNWDELGYVCDKVRDLIYIKGKGASARRYRNRLERLITELSGNDLAILRVEAIALLHELNDDIGEAVKYRQQEIELMERLHRSNPSSYALTNRGTAVLANRKKILKSLEKQLPHRP